MKRDSPLLWEGGGTDIKGWVGGGLTKKETQFYSLDRISFPELLTRLQEDHFLSEASHNHLGLLIRFL